MYYDEIFNLEGTMVSSYSEASETFLEVEITEYDDPDGDEWLAKLDQLLAHADLVGTDNEYGATAYAAFLMGRAYHRAVKGRNEADLAHDAAVSLLQSTSSRLI